MHRLPEHSFPSSAHPCISTREESHQEQEQNTPDNEEYFTPVAGRETQIQDKIERQNQRSSQVSRKAFLVDDDRRVVVLQAAKQDSSPPRRGSLLAELFSQPVDQTSNGDRAENRATNLSRNTMSSHTAILDGRALEFEGPLPTTVSNDTMSYSPSEVDLLRRAAMLPRETDVEEPDLDRSLYEHMLALLWEGHPHVRATLQLKYPGVGLDEIVRQWQSQQGYTVDSATWLPQIHGTGPLSCHTRGW